MLWENWYKSKNERLGDYTDLKAVHILDTLSRLVHRIEERFPHSGLRSVAMDCQKLADNIVDLLQRLEKPIWPLRILTGIAMLFVVAIATGFMITIVQHASGIEGWGDILQVSESGVNDLMFLGLALWFLASAENRSKNNAVLKSLHHLRSIAHIIDMHQLTKDPAYLLSKNIPNTASSPKRTMTSVELSRYLDYCSELLAIISKLAALHARTEDDSIILDAVNDIESLTQGLSSKIWQKLTLLDKNI